MPTIMLFNRHLPNHFLIFLAIQICSPLLANELPEVSIETIQAAVNAYRDSIHTLEGEHESTLESNGTIQAGLQMEELRLHYSFRVDLERGWYSLDRTKTWKYSDISRTEELSHYQRNTFDGKLSYVLLYTLGQVPVEISVDPSITNVPNRLNIHERNEILLEFLPWMYAGLTGRQGGLGIAAELQQKHGRVAGVENIAGTECYIVTIGEDLELALDPSRDFLPRRIHRQAAGESAYETWEILDFRQFTGARGNGQLWFPVHGRCSTHLSTREFRLHSLILNKPLQQDLFQIDPATLPDGVAVREEIGGKTNSYISGNRKDIWEQRRTALEAQERKMESLLPKVTQSAGATATPGPIRVPASRQGDWWVPLLATASATLLALGIWRYRIRLREP